MKLYQFLMRIGFLLPIEERLLHSHGQTTSDEVYKVLYSKLDTFTDLVFYIESEEEAKTLNQTCKKT